MRGLSSAGFQRLLQRKGRLSRRIKRAPRAVHYFHQVDDPYSQLAVQQLDRLRAAYDLPFRSHLVSTPAAVFQGSSDLFEQWALRDAASVAAGFHAHFPDSPCVPDATSVVAANNVLADHLDAPDFAALAEALGEKLWSGQPVTTNTAGAPGRAAIRDGDRLRTKLGHYLGGMFYYDGEWFWGPDRIRLLEARLREEGLGSHRGPLCVPEPTPADTAGLHAGHVVLEYFPSLRSPYTAVGHQRVLDLIERSGVSVKLSPVMPMLMRGVPAPVSKQRYIITDAAREARAHGVPFGKIVDPFGEPVRRAFALFPGAVVLQREMEFVTAYLTAAWADGIDISTESGLRRVVESAGMEWDELQQAAAGMDWQPLLDANLDAMLSAGLWGVPSFRISGGNDETAFACWGQDRIWRVENEIARRA